MDYERARRLLLAERIEVEVSARDAELAIRQSQEAEQETGDYADAAQPLAAQGEDDAILTSLRQRLDAIDRALMRLEDGTYGRSVRSGLPIPDERLEADPAAELTIEETRKVR